MSFEIPTGLVYVEREDGSFDHGTKVIPNVADNRERKIMQHAIDEGRATIVAWATSPAKAEQAVDRKLKDFERERKAKEESGVTWTSPTGDTLWFDSGFESQMRFSAAVSQLSRGRPGQATDVRWKCVRLLPGNQKFFNYEQMNQENLSEVADAVVTLVQKCFDAEAAAITKLLSGDMTADFQVEFDSL